MPNDPTRISADALKQLAAAAAAGNTHAATAVAAEIMARSGGRFDHLSAGSTSSTAAQILRAGDIARGRVS